jgi:protein-disulfide isomerase-like protein with CxxC motif
VHLLQFEVSVSESNQSIVDVVEITDPLCSVAWGTEPTFRLLRWRYGHVLRWRTVMGGLAGDLSTGVEGWTRESAAEPMEKYWRRVTRITGQPYPKPMHVMLRSTDPAGRAIKAAALQGPEVERRALRRIRESIFLFGRGPETPSEFLSTFADVPGFDPVQWSIDVASPAVAAAYLADWTEARTPNDYVRAYKSEEPLAGGMRVSEGHERYDFPTVLFRGPTGEHTATGWNEFGVYVAALEAALPGATSSPRPDPTVAEAFAEWGVLTSNELSIICGIASDDIASSLPPDVITYNWGDGHAYFTASEASPWGLR